MSTGQVTNPYGSVQDLGLIVNSDDYRREYTGLHTQIAYRFGNTLNVGGNWTYSHLIGDIVGETFGGGPGRGGSHVYPEYLQRSWNNPDRRPQQRHAAPRPRLRDLGHPDSAELRQPEPRLRPVVGHRHAVRRGRQRPG